MKRLLKIVLGLALAVVLLLVVAAVVLPMLYDTEDLKRTLSAQVKEQTGRELAIAGDLDFSVFPYLAVEINELSLGNAPGFGEQPFAQIGQASVGVALVPLLRKEIIIDEVTLSGLKLDLAVNASGNTNWDDLTGGDGEPAADTSDGTGQAFASQSIAGLNIQDAQIDYRDEQAGARYRLSDFDLTTGALGGGDAVPFELAMRLEDLEAGSALALNLAADANIDLASEVYALRDLRLTLDLDGEPVTVTAPSMTANLANDTLNMNAFTAKLAGLTATGNLKARTITGEPTFNGALQIAEFSPAEFMQRMNMEAIETSDPAALGSARVSANFEGSATRFALKELQMGLDDSQLTGEFRVRDFDAPVVRFDLNVDAIDLDRYMAPAPEGAGSAEEDAAIPHEELRGLDVQGTLRAARLRAMGLDLSEAEVGIKLADGNLRLNPLTAGFYGGTYRGNIGLDASGAKPVLSLNESIDSVVFQQLARDLLDEESISGDAFGKVKLTGTGATTNEMLSSLAGDVDLTLNDGALEGINVWYEIRKALALYKRQPAPEPEEDRTVFSRMKFSGPVQNGVLNTRELVGQLPFLDLTGGGKIDLVGQTVDLNLVAAVRDVPELAQDPLAADLKGRSLPFTIKGPLADPGIGLDIKEMLKGEATKKLLDKLGVSSSDEDGETSLEDQATGILGGLLGGDKDEEEEPKKKKRRKQPPDGG